MSSHLDVRLREGTQQSHTLAENTAFMKCFLKGVVERSFFRKLLANLYFVYSALEDALERHREHPIIGQIYFPEINRKANLEKDLAFYYGENWQEQIEPLEEGLVYVRRIQELADTDPVLLIAHAYTRYMGDLSGGQGLRQIARSAMNLPPDQGTALHEFDALPTVESKREFKDRYRHALDSMAIDEETIQRIVAEGNAAFAYNRNVMHALEADVIDAVGQHVFDLLTRQDRPGSTERPHRGHPGDLVSSQSNS